ncbi:hypothetical protein HY486_04135 [Candidatus Woesearchaeota archaeon]|nr:hypothetical protein [Candidatus Woesearchaeota archaeon]
MKDAIGKYAKILVGTILSCISYSLADESGFGSRTSQVQEVLSEVPAEKYRTELKRLSTEWALLSEQGKTKALEDLQMKYSRMAQYSQNAITIMSADDVNKARRKIARLGNPDGTARPDMEGIAWAVTVVANELCDSYDMQNNVTDAIIAMLSATSDFLQETTMTAKAAEAAITNHELLYAAESKDLEKKIAHYKHNEGEYPVRRKGGFLNDIGFGNINIDLDANASNLGIDGISISVFRKRTKNFDVLIEFLLQYKEGKEFKYQNGKGYIGLTPLED